MKFPRYPAALPQDVEARLAPNKFEVIATCSVTAFWLVWFLNMVFA